MVLLGCVEGARELVERAEVVRCKLSPCCSSVAEACSDETPALKRGGVETGEGESGGDNGAEMGDVGHILAPKTDSVTWAVGELGAESERSILSTSISSPASRTSKKLVDGVTGVGGRLST